MSHFKPVDFDAEAICLIYVGCVGFISNPGDLYLDRQGVERYNLDPDEYMRKHIGFASVQEMHEYHAVAGEALCGAKTKRGTLCKNIVHGYMDAWPKPLSLWRSLHRIGACLVHGGNE